MARFRRATFRDGAGAGCGGPSIEERSAMIGRHLAAHRGVPPATNRRRCPSVWASSRSPRSNSARMSAMSVRIGIAAPGRRKRATSRGNSRIHEPSSASGREIFRNPEIRIPGIQAFRDARISGGRSSTGSGTHAVPIPSPHRIARTIRASVLSSASSIPSSARWSAVLNRYSRFDPRPPTARAMIPACSSSGRPPQYCAWPGSIT